MIAAGGRAVHGVEAGVLMPEARFPHFPGDMGDARAWPFPVRCRVVRGASPDLLARRGAAGTLPLFIAAGRELVEEGCRRITTDCGFLSLFRAELSAALGVPVATSAPKQAAMVQATLPPGRRVGILAISAETLTPAHLAAAHAPERTPVRGVAEGCEFRRVILGNEERLDAARAEADPGEAATGFARDRPDLGALLFECIDMPPCKRAVRAATGLPVFSIETLSLGLFAALPEPQ